MLIIHFLSGIILIAFILFILFIVFFSKKVDFIYTWVDVHGGSAAFKSNDEILFSLRSICKHARWFHRVFLVISDTQELPDWLDHTQLQIVRHSHIIPKQYLPTFNSLCIESFLHLIPHLSEYYIYFNDDMILLNNVSINDFYKWDKPIESSCHPIHQSTDLLNDEYKFSRLLNYNNSLLNKFFGIRDRRQSQHIPSSNRVSFQLKLDDFLYRNNLNQHTQKRENKNIARYSLFKKYWNLYNHDCKEKKMDTEYIEINHIASKKKEIQNLLHSDKKFLCVQNSIEYSDKNSFIGMHDYIELKKILTLKFPEKCRFEK
jgi:hypothetical protein